MSSTTTNLGLKTWGRADKFLVDEINSNFQTIDNLKSIIDGGTVTSTYSGAISGTATWRYKKFVGGTYELDTYIIGSLTCGAGSAIPYYTDDITLAIPSALSTIYGYSSTVVSSGNCLVRTKSISTSSLVFCVNSFTKESSATNKEIYISIKGTWS